MVLGLLQRIDRRLDRVGLSSALASYLATGNRTTIRNMRTAARSGRPHDPRAGTLEALAPILMTSSVWLLYEAGPEEVMPPRETLEKIAAARKKGRKGRHSRRDVVVQNVEGPVKIIDKSVTVVGDDNAVSGNSTTATLPPGAGELMENVIEAIADIYKSMKIDITLAELGRLALERHTAILAACPDPAEFPYAMEIMKLRIRKLLEAPEQAQKDDPDATTATKE